MYNIKISIDPRLQGFDKYYKRRVATAIATSVKAEFMTLLHSAPQYSGNYVANMRLTVGDKRKESSPTYYFPEHPSPLEAKGNAKAINVAINENDLDSLESRFLTHFIRNPFPGPLLRVYNNLRSAEYIEGMPAERMRKVNKPDGVHAVEKFKDRLSRIKYNIHVNVK